MTEHTEAGELLPCPVCNSNRIGTFDRPDGIFVVSCENDDCHFTVETLGGSRSEAVNRWNDRPPSPEPDWKQDQAETSRLPRKTPSPTAGTQRSSDLLQKLDGAWEEEHKTNLMHYCDLAGQEIRKLLGAIDVANAEVVRTQDELGNLLHHAEEGVFRSVEAARATPLDFKDSRRVEPSPDPVAVKALDALEAAKIFADEEFDYCVDLPRKHHLNLLCNKIDGALAKIRGEKR